MRLLVVTPYYKPATVYGGTTRCISTLCEALVKIGVDVTVFTTNANGGTPLDVPLNQSTSVDGVNVFYFPLETEFTPVGRFFFSPKFGNACTTRITEFDLVALQDIWTYPSWIGARSCLRQGVPYYVTLHGSFLPRAINNGRLKKRLHLQLFGRRILVGASAIHCTSDIEVEALAPYNLHVPQFVIPNGIDMAVFENMPRRGIIRSRLGISDTAHVLLCLGRLHRVKRLDIAIHTLAAAQSLHQDVHLIIVGPDEDNIQRDLQSQAQQLKCSDKLHFTGLLESNDVLSCLTDADLLLMPSESENFGMSAAEALAAKLPILVSNKVPVGQWALKAGAGRIADCSKDDFSQAACDLLSNAEQLQNMSERGPEVVRRYFDVSVVAQQTKEQYKALVSSNTDV